jgi:hypothetical protein
MAENVTININAKDNTKPVINSVKMNLREMGEKVSGIGLRMSAAFTLPVLALGKMVLANEKVQAALKPVNDELAKVKDNFALAFLPIIKEAIPGILQFLGTLQKGISWFTGLDTGSQNAILSVVGLVAALGPVLTILGQILTVVGTLGTLLPGLGAAFTALFSFIGTVAAPIAAIVGAVTLLFNVIKDNLPIIKVIAGMAIFGATGKMPGFAIKALGEYDAQNANPGSAPTFSIAGLSNTLNNAWEGKAAGGSVGPGSYLVGERGPEVLTMGGSGYITPNNRLGGNTVNIVLPSESMFWTSQELQRKFDPIVKRIMRGA